MVAGARWRVEKFEGRVGVPFVKLEIRDNRGGASVLLSWQEALRLARDILDLLATEKILVRGVDLAAKPSGWKRRRPKRLPERFTEKSGEGEDGGEIREL